jgi:uncharacterized membrane protein
MKHQIISFVKKIKPIWIVSFLLAVCLVIFICQFVSKKFNEVKDGAYIKGQEAGRVEINNAIIQQLVSQGKIGINLPLNEQGQYDIKGKITTIFLIPQK